MLIFSLDVCCKHSALLSVHIFLMKNCSYKTAINKHSKIYGQKSNQVNIFCFDVSWVPFWENSSVITNINLFYYQYAHIVHREVWPSSLWNFSHPTLNYDLETSKKRTAPTLLAPFKKPHCRTRVAIRKEKTYLA